MSEYIICGFCGFRGLEIGSSVCSLCHNNPSNKRKNKNTQKYLDSIQQREETHLQEEKIDLYEKYKVKNNPYNLPKHPSVLMESALLHSVQQESVSIALNQQGVASSKKISNIQGETVMFILSKFQEIESGERSGFFLGDGTGCGKGRIISAVIQELLLTHKKKKAVWLSVSQDLENDSKRDLNDIGCHIQTCNLLDKEYPESGVMFATYSSIVKPKRLCDLREWLGDDFDGLIAMDECHKAKQCNGNKSKTASTIIALQDMYPLARVLYVSATGCSQVEHMGYMTRLGLWGKNATHENYSEFVNKTNLGGDFANEMIAMYLKKKGSYIARSLSYKQVTTGVSMIDSSHFSHKYNEAVQFIKKLHISGLIEGKLKMLFGSAQLRFFRSLVLTFKVPQTIKMIQAVLDDNMSVVITLQSTQETHQVNTLEEFDAPQNTLVQFIKLMMDYYENNDVKQQKCVDLMDELQSIRFGDSLNVIDTIIEAFGRENVAEITGRKRYSTRQSTEYRKLTNNQEKDLFMNGSKRVCIISEAGSVGISLHDKSNTHRRFHILLELPWSAEQFMQQCGRTHRSGQKTAPHYQLIVTDLPSESRFMSIILKRLRTLGALTNGNRFIKTDMFQLGENYESVEGDIAMRNAIENITTSYSRDVFGTNCDKVSRFFNRMMMLDIKEQKIIFERFHQEYMKQCNKTTQSKQHIHDIYVSNLCEHHSASIHPKAQLTSITVKAQGLSYNDMTKNIDKHVETHKLIKANNRTLGYAIRCHQHSDVYRLYQHNKVKYTTVNMQYIRSEFSEYKEDTLSFQTQWDSSLSTTQECVKLVTGDLYDIKAEFDKHPTTKNIQLKRVVNPYDNTFTPILGFRIHDKIENLIKQIIHQL